MLVTSDPFIGGGHACRPDLASRPDDRYQPAPPHPPSARRQPLRDRHPRLPGGDRARHPDGRDLRRGGQALAAPVQGRRGLSGRPRQGAARGLSRHRRGDPGRQGARGRRDPSGLRLPVGKPGVRRSLRRGRHHLHRPDAARPCARWATRWRRATSRSSVGAPVMPATEPLPDDPDDDPPARRRDRLSGDAQGVLGRRRARHAPDRPRGAAARRGPDRAARGQGRVRQGRGLSREAGPARAPCRGPAAGRHARQPGPPVRARLHHPAPAPEGDRARAGALSRRGAPRGAVRGGAQDRRAPPTMSAPARSSS